MNEATASVMAVMVWKARQEMNPLGVCLFAQKVHGKSTRLAESKNICPPVPGIHMLPSNLLAKVWNSVPGLHTASNLGTAKSIARKWA